MADYPIYRLVKGDQLTFTEMDDNLRWLSQNMSGSKLTLTGSSIGVTGSMIITGDVQISGTASIGFIKSEGFSSGSNQLGDDTGDFQTLVGVVSVSGSFGVSGSTQIPNLTGSLFGTSSYAKTAISSSWPVSASFEILGNPTSLYSIALDTNQDANESTVALGWRAGKNKKTTGYDVYVGDFAGYIDNNLASSSVSVGNTFVGSWAGYNANYSSYSTFIGDAAGLSASYAANSFFAARGAGAYAVSASESVIIGFNSGVDAYFASRSVFIGAFAGGQVTSTPNLSSSNAAASVFIGYSAGAGSGFANESVFLGRQAGQQAPRANNSFYVGYLAGANAVSASNSIFLGRFAGRGNANASHSIFLGFQAGYNGGSSLGYNNTVIGTNITLPAGYANYANIGAVLYVSGTYGTVTGNPRQTAVTGNVGVNQVNPQFNLDVSGSGRYTNGLEVTGSMTISGSLTVSTTTGVFLPPTMTSTQKTALGTPAVGSMVYQTDATEGVYVYTSTGWKILTM